MKASLYLVISVGMATNCISERGMKININTSKKQQEIPHKKVESKSIQTGPTIESIKYQKAKTTYPQK